MHPLQLVVEVEVVGQFGQPVQQRSQPRQGDARLDVVVQPLGTAVVAFPHVAQDLRPRHEILAAGQRQGILEVLAPMGGDLVGLGLGHFAQRQEMFHVGVADRLVVLDPLVQQAAA